MWKESLMMTNWLTHLYMNFHAYSLTQWPCDSFSHIHTMSLSHTLTHADEAHLEGGGPLMFRATERVSTVFSIFLISALDESLCPGALASPETCRTSPAGVARWISVKPVKTCHAVEAALFFTLLWIVLKSPVCSQEEPEGMASASGISHSPVTLPQLSLPPVKGHGGQWPRWGSGTAGRHVLFTSSLLMCGLACFNWHVAFARVSVAFVGVTVLTLS